MTAVTCRIYVASLSDYNAGILHGRWIDVTDEDTIREEIAAMLNGARNRKRLGVCLDTCHLLASGYDLCTKEGYEKTFRAFDELIGLDRLRVFHVNDSKKPCMSRVDRHEHIGKGCIGLEPFRRLVNDKRFEHLPMILETEKSEWRERGKIAIDPLDEMNLNTLRGLLARGQKTRF